MEDPNGWGHVGLPRGSLDDGQSTDPTAIPRCHPRALCLPYMCRHWDGCSSSSPQKGEIKMKGSGVRCIHLHLSFERFVRTKEVLSSLSKVCNASPAGFHLRCLIDTLMSMMGKVVGAARGPLCKGFKTLSVLQLMRGAGVRSRMGALYRLTAATLHSGGALHPLPFVPRPAVGGDEIRVKVSPGGTEQGCALGPPRMSPWS